MKNLFIFGIEKTIVISIIKIGKIQVLKFLNVMSLQL